MNHYISLKNDLALIRKKNLPQITKIQKNGNPTKHQKIPNEFHKILEIFKEIPKTYDLQMSNLNLELHELHEQRKNRVSRSYLRDLALFCTDFYEENMGSTDGRQRLKFTSLSHWVTLLPFRKRKNENSDVVLTSCQTERELYVTNDSFWSTGSIDINTFGICNYSDDLSDNSGIFMTSSLYVIFISVIGYPLGPCLTNSGRHMNKDVFLRY